MGLHNINMMIEHFLQLASNNLKINYFTDPLRALRGSIKFQIPTNEFYQLIFYILVCKQMLEAEVSVNQTVADAYVAQSLQLLDTTETEKR